MAFKVPNIKDNPDSWGPPPDEVPEEFKDVPFQNYSKSEKLGKVADWTQGGYGKFGGSRYQGGGGMNTVFNFFAQDEEDTFHLVDNRPMVRTKYGQRRFQQQRFQRGPRDTGRDQGGGAERERLRRERQQSKKQQQWNYFQGNRQFGDRAQYTSSVDIRPDWTVVEQIQLPSLTKLNYEVKVPTDEVAAGVLELYNKELDRVTPKTEKPLQRFVKRVFRNVTASEDPILKRLAQEGRAQVFSTDGVLSALMCAPRSVYGWDIVITKQGDTIFLDKRDESNFDLLTVNETAQEAVPEDKDNINGVEKLSLEATMIDQNFSQQVLCGPEKRKDFPEPNPFAEGETDIAPVGYKYRRWEIDGETALMVRCELHALVDYKGEELTCTVKALNEFDSKVSGMDWRQKIETQRGAVLATELKNNANKLAKWTCQALLSGADMMKIGYVTRSHPRDNLNHVVLTTQTHKPKDFATQINLSVNNMWGIFKAVIDLIRRQEDGKFLLVKDPNKPLLRLYDLSSSQDFDTWEQKPQA